KLPADSVAGLVDGRNRVVARAPALAAQRGKKASDWYAEALTRTDSGTATGEAPDGTDGFVAFARVGNAPRTGAVALPRAVFAQAWLRPLALLAVGGALFVVLVSYTSLGLAARLTAPLDTLAEAARSATRGQPVPEVPPSKVRELHHL